MIDRNVVRIEFDDLECPGSGYVVAPGRVLTSGRVAEADGGDCYVHHLDGRFLVKGRLYSSPLSGVDVAVLDVPGVPRRGGLSVSLCGVAEGAEWRACGFPKTRGLAGHKAGGTVEMLRPTDYDLGVRYKPEEHRAWQGLSGSAVVVAGAIVAVVVRAPEDFKGGIIVASALAALRSDRDFLRAVEHADPWDGFISWAEPRLRDADEVCQGLAQRLGCAQSADDVVRALVPLRASQLAHHVYRLMKKVGPNSKDSDLLDRLLREHLRYAVPSTVCAAFDQAAGHSSVEAPVAHDTSAMLAVARGDGHAPTYVRRGSKLVAPTQVIEEDLGIDGPDTEKRVTAVNLKHHLINELGFSGATEDDVQRQLRARLKFHAQEPDADEPRYFATVRLSDDGDWARLEAQGGGVLEHLKLVRLAGASEAEMDEEYVLAEALLNIRKLRSKRARQG